MQTFPFLPGATNTQTNASRWRRGIPTKRISARADNGAHGLRDYPSMRWHLGRTAYSEPVKLPAAAEQAWLAEGSY